MASRKKTLKVRIREHPTADRRRSVAVRFGPAQRNSISCLGEAATKVLQLQRSSLSHDNSRKIREDLLCLLPYRPILAAAHQCRNRYRHPHCHLPQNHRNRPSKHLPQRGQRQRQRYPQLRGQNRPTWRLSPNPLSQRAIRAANQNQIHRPRPCHKPIVQQPTRRNGAPLSMVVALVRTRSRHHLPCLRASRLRSASERVSYLRSGDRAITAKMVHYDAHVPVLLLCYIIPKEVVDEDLALREGVMRSQNTFPTRRGRQRDEKSA